MSFSGYNQVEWVLQAPWGRAGIAAGAALCVALVIMAWLSSQRLPTLGRRIAAFVARLIAISCAFLLFLQPSLELAHVEREPNSIAVVVDSSLSMGLPSEQGAKAKSRAEVAREIVAASSETLKRWRQHHQVDFYTFSSDLEPATEALDAKPTGEETRFGKALTRLSQHDPDKGLGGVILLSDGTATDEWAPGKIKELATALGAPIHPIWVAKPGLDDVAISRVMADEFAFVRTLLPLEVEVVSTGSKTRRLPITLSVDGKEVQEKWITLAPGKSQARVRFEYTPQRVGKYVYQISTPVDPDEAVADNNSDAVLVRVIRDKIRVLHVAGAPSWDVRALRGILKQNPNVDLISFFILRTLFDTSGAGQSEMSLIQFPTEELFSQELPSFDVIILHNFDYGPYGIGQYLGNIREYVQGGGGLVMIGGEGAFESGGYAGTPLADVLPFAMANADRLDAGEFQPTLTELGRVHPVTQLRFDAASNAARWQSLPPLQGANITIGAQPDAVVLLTHPKLLDKRGQPLPILAAMDAGDGRTLGLATDSQWRWWFAPEGALDHHAAYEKFWENVIRWITRDPEFERLELTADEIAYQPDAPVTLRVRVLDWDYTRKPKASVRLKLLRGFDPKRAEQVRAWSIETRDDGQADIELGSLPAGVYRAVAATDQKGQTLTTTELFSVRAGRRELSEPNPDPSFMQELAKASGGRFIALPSAIPDDLPWAQPKVSRVDRQAIVELWSGAWLLCIALLALGFEWGLRQRSGYL